MPLVLSLVYLTHCPLDPAPVLVSKCPLPVKLRRDCIPGKAGSLSQQRWQAQRLEPGTGDGYLGWAESIFGFWRGRGCWLFSPHFFAPQNVKDVVLDPSSRGICTQRASLGLVIGPSYNIPVLSSICHWGHSACPGQQALFRLVWALKMMWADPSALHLILEGGYKENHACGGSGRKTKHFASSSWACQGCFGSFFECC